jgi:peroxiredoxin
VANQALSTSLDVTQKFNTGQVGATDPGQSQALRVPAAPRSPEKGSEPRSPFLVGDIAPPFALPALDGTIVDIRDDAIAGNSVVILFCPKFLPAITEAVAALTAAQGSFTAAGARLFAVTLEPEKIAAAQNIPFPVLCDRDGKVFRAFSANTLDLPTTVVLRPNQHSVEILNSAPQAQATGALVQIERLAAERQAVQMAPHPPVLVLPDVLSPADCRRLIDVYETRGQTFMPLGAGIDYIGTDYKMRMPDYGRGDRIDHWIVDKDTETLLYRHIAMRVVPEIAKAFQYRITRWERLRIAGYEGQRGGELHGHRDNVEPTPYRRFAMSINLNTEEFTGGELRFPEFGDQRYRPESGAAIVFSSSLLHEAMHVTSGRRFVLLAFLFGDR